MSKDRKEKWYAVLVPSFMSSEESAEDEGDNPTILHVKKIPWRQSQVSEDFAMLDDKAYELKSKHAEMQMFTRCSACKHLHFSIL